MGKMSATEQAAWEAKVKSGPTGLLVVRPNGANVISPRQLLSELTTSIISAFLGALLLSRLFGRYLTRVGLLGVIGLIGWVSILLSYWNWYAFPLSHITAEGLIEVVGWVLAGLVMAAIVKAPKVAA